MQRIEEVLRRIKEQLGVQPVFVIKIINGEAELSIRWKDEGGNIFQLAQCFSQTELQSRPITDFMTPLCKDVQDLLESLDNERRELFLLDLLHGKIPANIFDMQMF